MVERQNFYSMLILSRGTVPHKECSSRGSEYNIQQISTVGSRKNQKVSEEYLNIFPRYRGADELALSFLMREQFMLSSLNLMPVVRVSNISILLQ